MKKQFTLTDSDFATLDRVSLSCGLTHSQTLSQLIRRYSSDLEKLLATPVNLQQPQSTYSNSDQPASTYVNLEQPSSNLSQPKSANPRPRLEGLD